MKCWQVWYQRPTSLNMRILADHVTYSFLAFMKSIFHFCLGCYCGRSNLSSFTCIAEQVTSEVVDMFSRGGRDCHFANTSVEMAKFVRSAVQLRRQCFINPWTQTALFLIIATAATSAAVSWQFAGWISPIPPWLYSTAVNKVWCLQCGQML